METEEGGPWLKHLAYYVRTHEKALATALQQRQQTRHHPNDSSTSLHARPSTAPPPTSGATSSLASALTFGLASTPVKPSKLCLTPNQLYYLLSRYEELGVTIGPMNVRLENLSSDSTPMEYVSFLAQATRPKGRSADQDSLHSVSSVRSVVSTLSSMWSNIGGSSNSTAKEEKRKAIEREDLKYLYSACTKIPVLKLMLDHRTRRIKGFEEFPFDTAVPLWVFKNISVLEIVDLDFRSFYGWERLAEQLRSLTVKRAGLDDLSDLLTNIVLDDIDRRRRRSAKTTSSPVMAFNSSSPARRHAGLVRASTMSDGSSLQNNVPSVHIIGEHSQTASMLPPRPILRPGLSDSPPNGSFGRPSSVYLPPRRAIRHRRSSSDSSAPAQQTPRTSSSDLLSTSGLSIHKWRFLRHLCVADNGLTTITSHSLHPLIHTLQSLDLSSNLFSEIPDTLSTLTSLRALNLSNCMIESLHSLTRNPLPAITVLNLRGNRLPSLAGVEKMPSLERLELRENRLTDPTELARLTGMPNLREVFVAKNPFTKTHPNYRITIFNLFRQSHGYSQDLLIDGTGPGSSERRQLVNRVPERTIVPVIKPPTEDEQDPGLEPAAVVLDQTRIEGVPISEEPQTPVKTRPARPSRKITRRRVVDMSSSPQTPASNHSYETSPEATFVTALQSPNTVARRRAEADMHVTPSRPESSRLKTHASTSAVPTEAGLSEGKQTQTVNMSLSGEQYRKRIEALKTEYGSGWLSALGQDNDPFGRGSATSPGTVG